MTNTSYMKDFPIELLQKRVAFERDENAYREIFIHFYKPLLNFTISLVKANEIAEEIVSDILMKLWEMKDGLVKVSHLKVYLFKAAKNRAINHLERSKKHNRKDIDDIDVELDTTLFADDPAKMLESKELKAAIISAVKELPPKCGMVYKLVREEGLTYKEVGAIMEISENTVDRHLSIALYKIVNTVRSTF